MCIPAGSGEDQPAPVGTDGELEFAGQVVNNGPDVSDATVVITLPAGLRLDPNSDGPISRLDQWWSDDSDGDGTALDCTTSQDGLVSTCSTGPVPAGANFLVLVDVAAQDDAVAGTSGTLRVALQSAPAAGAFPGTAVHATVDFVGTAHLQVSLTPSKASVTVGHSLSLVATIHNAGPNKAVEAAAIGLVSSQSGFHQPFLITNSAPLPGEDAGSGTSSGSAFLLRAFPAAGSRKLATRNFATKSSSTPAPAPLGFWPVGTIAAGGTATVKVVVKAESVGDAELDFIASSADESCDDPSAPDCENVTAAELSAVAPTTTTATTARPSTTTSTVAATTAAVGAVSSSSDSSAASGTSALPNTGFELMPWVGSAGAVILLGVGLMVLGAPRRRVRGHHR